MKKRRKQYSAGAIIWIIFKYVSLVFFSFVAVIPIISCVMVNAPGSCDTAASAWRSAVETLSQGRALLPR